MKSTPKTLLFLNALSKEQLQDFTDYSLNVDSTPLIETEALSFDKSLLDTNIPWVFTSQTAVDAIVDETIEEDMSLISGIPPWVQMYFEKLSLSSGKLIKELFPNFKLFIYGGVNFKV